jgi:exodeoxyribonuclease VII large subunit
MRIITVSELTRHVKELIDKDYVLANVWVSGEISNFKAAASGHCYFTLKDHRSCLKVVMFRSKSRRLLFRPENGMAVTVRGYVSVYERDGTYQLYAGEMEAEGTGALYLAFEQLKEKLQREGLFDKKHKKPLPFLPRRIGIVTSPTGAAVRDMLEIIRRRWPGREIILAPVPVQGQEAPPAVARGLQLLNRLDDVELIIVGRGGGSLEELWAFNTEVVARSIFQSRIPVISAVGHENDFTIADFAADARAATPSAAAEMAVPDKKEIIKHLNALSARLSGIMNQKVEEGRQRFFSCVSGRIFTRPVDVVCSEKRQALDMLHHSLIQGISSTVDREKNRLAVLAGRMQVLSPLSTLARGYSICTRWDGGQVVSDAQTVVTGEKLLLRLHQGVLRCTVEDKMTC